MVAAPHPRLTSSDLAAGPTPPLALLQGALPTRKPEDLHVPSLTRLHHVADVTLAGASLALLVMVCLTLHWQERWTLKFTNLDRTRLLTHRLTETTAMLEQHLLEHGQLPQQMLLARADDLIYLDRPSYTQTKKPLLVSKWIRFLLQQSVQSGY